ncbi:MAG: hypothetical protein R3C44_06140 [Chloroflexota bacterium]
MQNSMLIAALIVFVIWILIMGIYLATSRKQLSMEETIDGLEEELDSLEKGAK